MPKLVTSYDSSAKCSWIRIIITIIQRLYSAMESGDTEALNKIFPGTNWDWDLELENEDSVAVYHCMKSVTEKSI